MAIDRYKSLLLILLFSVPAFWTNADEIGGDLSGYEPSYFVYADDGVDAHGEFKISIKYPLVKGEDLENYSKLKSTNFYFSYTGKYDFFLFSEDVPGRESAPVVSRIQNPGFFVQHIVDDDNEYGIESISIGWFHESNGQNIEGRDRTTFNNTLNASDYVSRGWDYLGVDVKLRKKDLIKSADHIDLTVRLRHFCDCQGFGLIGGKEDDIFVFGDPGTADIRDYDGLRLIFDYHYDNWQLGTHIRSGTLNTDALSNLTYKIEATYILGNVPLYVFYFNGYGENISTYHIKNDYYGVGIKIW